MSLSLAEVRHIARLARLHLTEAEERDYQQQLSSVLEHAARLQTVDTEHIAPTATVVPMDAPLRADEVRDCPPPADILANAARVERGMFRVPPVMEPGP